MIGLLKCSSIKMSHYCPLEILQVCEARRSFYDQDQTKIFLARLNNSRSYYKQNPSGAERFVEHSEIYGSIEFMKCESYPSKLLDRFFSSSAHKSHFQKVLRHAIGFADEARLYENRMQESKKRRSSKLNGPSKKKRYFCPEIFRGIIFRSQSERLPKLERMFQISSKCGFPTEIHENVEKK